MFEVTFYQADGSSETRVCNVGDLLPTIATFLQEFERDYGKYEYQCNYAVRWRRVKE